MSSRYFTYKTICFCWIWISLLCVGKSSAQGSSKLYVKYTTPEILITAGELVSNVIHVYNPSDQEISFHVNLDYPPEWKQVTRIKESYTIAAGDSLFLPIRYIPNGNLSGNNRFMLSAFLIAKDDQPLGNDFFWAYTKKQTSWSLSTEQGNKIYFKNGENTAKFNMNILNTGTEKQQIILTVNNLSLYSEVTDSLGKNVSKEPVNLYLSPFQDTTFRYVFKYTQGKRNASRIDIENHKPENLNEERTFNLLLATEEPNYGQPGAYQAAQRFTFKRLPDDKQANAQNFSHIPVIVDYNLSNVMDNVSFSNLTVRGVAQLSVTSQLMYNLQANAVGNNYEQFLTNNNYYAGYFYKKGSVQAGYLNGGIMGVQSFGRGLKVTRMLNKRNTVTAFYIIRTDRFDRPEMSSYGGAWDITYYKQNKARIEMGRSENLLTGANTTAINYRAGIQVLKTQSFSFNVSNTYNYTPNAIKERTFGYFVMGNYGGTFARGRLSLNHGTGYNTSDYGNAGTERIFYTHRTRYSFSERWSATIANNYNSSTSQQYKGDNNSITNQLTLNRAFQSKSIQPQVFYHIFHQPLLSYNMKGVGLSYNQFNVKTSARFSTSIEGGVNEPMNIPNASSTTFMQWNTLLFFKTTSINARYIVGTYGYVPPTANSSSTAEQQLFTASAQHQYLFKNTKVMIQSGMNYSYNNIFKQHSITYAPDIYYFTTEGWRFRLSFNYNVISGIALRNSYSSAGQSQSGEEQSRITNQNTFISLGIRKEFSAPIPFKKAKFCDVHFNVFYDVNGDGQKDKNERVIENVVIRLGQEEVISNTDGEAHIRNASMRRQSLLAIPLEDANGWFPNIEDSVLVLKDKEINIPFVKGVKIKGKIGIDRETIVADADDPFDLSRIRITAYGQKEFSVLTDFNGAFEFYLPYGKYTLTMDEGVLGTKFKVARNNYEIEVSKEADGMVVSYLVIERKRKIVKKVFNKPATEEPAKALPAPAPKAPAPKTPAQRRR